MTDIALPSPAPKQPPMSPWYRHWKDIATVNYPALKGGACGENHELG